MRRENTIFSAIVLGFGFAGIAMSTLGGAPWRDGSTLCFAVALAAIAVVLYDRPLPQRFGVLVTGACALWLAFRFGAPYVPLVMLVLMTGSRLRRHADQTS